MSNVRQVLKLNIYRGNKEVSCCCGSDVFYILDVMFQFKCINCHRGYTKRYIEDSPTLVLQPQEVTR